MTSRKFLVGVLAVCFLLLGYDLAVGFDNRRGGGAGGAFSQGTDTTISPAVPVVLDNATGDETAYDFSYTVNKATSGTTTGVYINSVATSAPGTDYAISIDSGGVNKVHIQTNGRIFTQNNLYLGVGSTMFSDILSSRGANADLTLDANGTGTTILNDLTTVCDGACPSWGIASGAGDLGVGDDLEVAGDVRVDESITIQGDPANDVFISFNGSLFGGIKESADDGLMIHLYGSAENRANKNLIITDFSNRSRDHGHDTVSTNPTVFLHSATDPDTDNTQWLSLAHDQTDGVVSVGTGAIKLDATTIKTAQVTRKIYIDPASVVRGPTAPDRGIIGTYEYLGFDAAAEQAAFEANVPTDWAGGTGDDWTIRVAWVNEAGDAVADGETVKWDLEYRCSDVMGGEVYDNGTAGAATTTYTQSGAGTDKEFHYTDITIDADDSDQPLVISYGCGFVISRDTATDDYSGEARIIRIVIMYPSTQLPVH